MDKENLKHWAIALEKEMALHRLDSKHVEALFEYPQLIDAIAKAKNLEIQNPILLSGLTAFFFETNIRDFKKLNTALSAFSLILEGLELPNEG